MIFKAFLILIVTFNCTVRALEFECYYLEDNYWSITGNIYGCKVDQIRNIEDTELFEVTGDHEVGFGNEDVEALIVVGTNFLSIPLNIGEVLSNIKVLEWKSSSLKTITANDLEQFPNLEILDLSGNDLIKLDGDLFTHTPNVKVVVFNTNALKIIEDDLLVDLIQLQSADFRQNVCINESTSNDGVGFTQLRKIFTENCAAESGETTTKSPITLSTTTKKASNKCSSDCVSQIKALEKKLTKSISKLESDNKDMNSKVKKSKTKIDELEKRLAILLLVLLALMLAAIGFLCVSQIKKRKLVARNIVLKT